MKNVYIHSLYSQYTHFLHILEFLVHLLLEICLLLKRQDIVLGMCKVYMGKILFICLQYQ